MFDFTDVEIAVINDLKSMYVQQYLILNESNILPKEVNLIIMYDRLQISDNLQAIRKDIEYSHKNSMAFLIARSLDYSIDILLEYDNYLMDLPCIRYWGNREYFYHQQYDTPQNICIDLLYSLDNNIFYKLLSDYLIKNDQTINSYKINYDMNLENLKIQLGWKTNSYYIKLLKIIDPMPYLSF